jgi:hypothetical protein
LVKKEENLRNGEIVNDDERLKIYLIVLSPFLLNLLRNWSNQLLIKIQLFSPSASTQTTEVRTIIE